MNFEKKLESCILDIISGWKEQEIYAISFLLTTNELSEYKGINNFPEFSIGYNTEKDCDYASALDEERWNYACWSQNNTILLDENTPEIAEELLVWYKDMGIVDIGIEPDDQMYDEEGNYIGKGPNGYWDLLGLISNIARKLQNDGEIKRRFGNIPIIVHDLEYSWYVPEITQNANPNGEADVFLKYLLNLSSGVDDYSVSN